jgi:hypothetical protein
MKPAPDRGIQSVAWLIFVFLWTCLIFGSYRYLTAPPSCASIYKLPYEISEPGCYKLAKDISLPDMNSVGIVIHANRVSLDLGTHHIEGPKQAGTSSIGISVTEAHDILIQNGVISGFLYGVRVDSGSPSRKIERIELNSLILTDNSFRGALIHGVSTMVRNVTVRRTGGTTLFASADATGIEVAGRDCYVVDNTILETYAVGAGEAKGLALGEDAGGCVVQGNIIKNTRLDTKNQSMGIWSKKENKEIGIISDNQISGFKYESFRY